MWANEWVWESIDLPVKMYFPLGIDHIYIINCQSFPYIMQLLIILAKYCSTAVNINTWREILSLWDKLGARSFSSPLPSSPSLSLFLGHFLSFNKRTYMLYIRACFDSVEKWYCDPFKIEFAERFHHFAQCAAFSDEVVKFNGQCISTTNHFCYNEHFQTRSRITPVLFIFNEAERIQCIEFEACVSMCVCACIGQWIYNSLNGFSEQKAVANKSVRFNCCWWCCCCCCP